MPQAGKVKQHTQLHVVPTSQPGGQHPMEMAQEQLHTCANKWAKRSKTAKQSEETGGVSVPKRVDSK